MNQTTLHHDLLPGSEFPTSVPLLRRTASQADTTVTRLLDGSHSSRTIGISYGITAEGRLDFICLANVTLACLIRFNTREPVPKNGPFASLLAASGQASSKLIGFQLSRTAIQVAQTTKLRVRGIDLLRQSQPNDRESSSPSDIVRGRVCSSAKPISIARLWRGGNETGDGDIALQAWLAACVGSKLPDFSDQQVLDTDRLQTPERTVVARLVAQIDLFDWAKPWESTNDFFKGEVDSGGSFRLHNSRFKTRTLVVLEDANGTEFTGKATHVKGKQTTIAFKGSQPNVALRNVRVIGREDATNSEKASDSLIYSVLAGRDELLKSTFTKKFWFPQWFDSWNLEVSRVDPTVVTQISQRMKLNNSQRLAIELMTGNTPVVIIHGPPGTGKTTTIAATAHVWQHYSYATWIVAHSNVAVKNIAETLSKKQVDFKLLVSKDFYEEWHEHLYEEVEHRLIRSDELPGDFRAVERVIGGSQVVLSTLSMLSNPALRQNGMFKVVPVRHLIIDEASQINIFEYLHIFHRFYQSLLKVCFFGDPQQLPPFGKDDIPSIQTVFDLNHLMRSSETVFLDTQYRMPSPIGDFISKYVYGGRLKTQHDIHTPDCLTFVDAGKTGEEKAGNSTRNTGEIDAIVNLVRNYYKHKDFCVITPYDAQRAAIQSALERENLPWESVYNLDSFQGNEAEYVLISVVRSSKPGFLTSVNRMNVMLTRCRKGMVIVSSRAFLQRSGSGYSTLLGKLLAYWECRNGEPWVDWREVSAGTASLPGSTRQSQATSWTAQLPVRTVTAHVRAVNVPTIPALSRERELVSPSTSTTLSERSSSVEILPKIPKPRFDQAPVWPSLSSLSLSTPETSEKSSASKELIAGPPRPKVKTVKVQPAVAKKTGAGFIRSVTIHDASSESRK